LRLFEYIKNKKITSTKNDIIAGIIVALVSIPISMGYTQIAGLPVIYGLYGSILPIIVFGLMSTSPQFVVGVDAMPAAMVGGLLATLGIAAESEQAMSLVPVVSILVAMWFIVFYFFRAGRIVKFISTPVMSGFISGVGITIILMQVPKLFGGTSGTGEIFALLKNIYLQLNSFNWVSALLGIGTVLIILICKKRIPRVPMTVIMMGVGALLQVIFRLDNYGVLLLPEIRGSIFVPVIPDFSIIMFDPLAVLVESLSISGVIMAQTLLATGGYASKYGDTVDNNKELLAYCGMNAASGLIGCCPVNGSVSRSNIADSFGARSQIMSISAGFTMLLVLLFGTPLLKYLPVPILTGIVMTALIGIIDVKMFTRLFTTCKNEWVIFILSLVGVLVLGTVGGVIVGCLLSFWEVAVRSVAPPSSFVGRIPGHGNFHSLNRNSHAHPIKHTIIYRFSGNLFFANIDKLEDDIENAIREDTKQVVVDARGIGSIDITAVDRLLIFNNKLKEKGIRFYITEHESSLNDQIRELGGGSLIEDGVVRRTITLALRDAGLEKPYELEGAVNEPDRCLESEEKLAEFEWAFGDEAEERLRILAENTALEIAEQVGEHDEHIAVLEDHGATTKWGMLGLFDEHDFWVFLEEKLLSLYEDGVISEEDAGWIEKRIEQRRIQGVKRLNELNPKALSILSKHRHRVLEHMKEHDEKRYEHFKEFMEHLHGDFEE